MIQLQNLLKGNGAKNVPRQQPMGKKSANLKSLFAIFLCPHQVGSICNFSLSISGWKREMQTKGVHKHKHKHTHTHEMPRIPPTMFSGVNAPSHVSKKPLKVRKGVPNSFKTMSINKRNTSKLQGADTKPSKSCSSKARVQQSTSTHEQFE